MVAQEEKGFIFLLFFFYFLDKFISLDGLSIFS
jgi:hypothetical protein